jgi:membrane protease YdiL (CAAX protease family)
LDSTFDTKGQPSYGLPNEKTGKEVVLYVISVLGFSTLIVACFPFLHITNNWAGNALAFIPGIAAVVFLLRSREGFRSVGWGAGPLIYWLWAILLPVIAIAVSLSISIRLGYAALAPASTAIGKLALHPSRVLENIVIYTAIAIPFTFAEELGWRGYAQGKLIRRFGLVAGLILLGIIWGLWHTPIYYFLHTYPEHPFLGPFVMTPIDNILAVVPMGWLYIRSRNIWVPTLTHAFADVLWGFSGLIFPPTQEIRAWGVLQAAQLIISALLLMDLLSHPAKPAEIPAQTQPVSV